MSGHARGMSRAAWYDVARDVIVVDRVGEVVELDGAWLIAVGLAAEAEQQEAPPPDQP